MLWLFVALIAGLRGADIFDILDARIEKDHPHDVGRVPRGVEAHQEAAQRMSDDEKGPADRRGFEHVVEIVHIRVGGARHRARIAEIVTGTIVRTNASELGESRLHENPARRVPSEPGLENDGGASLSHTS